MIRSIILWLPLFLCSTFAHSQWTTNTTINTLVADSEGGDMKAIGASDGSTYIVFWKVVAAPTNYELRMQVLDSSGLQQLGNDGVLVSDQISMSTFTVIWSIEVDSNDNLYVGVTGTGDESGHAFKLDLEGNHLWGSAGVSLGIGYSVKISPMSSGEAIVSWFPSGAGKVQKFDTDGNAVWSAPQSVSTGTGSSVVADMFEMSDGGFIAVYHSLSFGISSTLYAQRFDGGGAAQWSSSTQLSNETTAFNREYGGTQDGDVVYYGYFAAANNRFDAYVQRIDSDGSIPWGINGTDFDANETDYEMDTRIAHSPGSDNLWAICTYTNTAQSELGERVQKFDKNTGARLLSENAHVVYPISGNHNKHASRLFLVGDKPFFQLSSGLDNGATPTSLGVVLLDELGEFFWLEGSIPVATYEANKSRVLLTRPVDGQAVSVFIEDKGSGSRIYAQNYSASELTTGILEVSESIRLTSYPNPSTGLFTVKLTSDSDQLAQVLICSNTGAIIVQKQVVLRAGENQIELDMEGASTGVYSYRLIGENLIAVGELVLIGD